jgi:rhodanese-related sulfurtransferase
MKRIGVLALLTLVQIVGLAACKAARTSQRDARRAAASSGAPAAEEQVERIGVRELSGALASAGAFVVDVRSEPEFKEGRIKGATLLPRRELAARLSELPKDKLIVTYCACPFDHLSIEAAREIKRGGLGNVAVLRGGFTAWVKEGLPTETFQAAPRTP